MRLPAIALLAGALLGCRHASTTSDAPPGEASASRLAPAVEDVAARADKLDKPVAKLSKDDVEAALAKGGWRVTTATETSSGKNRTILVGAKKGPWIATVKVYSHADPFWSEQLAKEQGAAERRGDALIGVVIPGKPDEARLLLDSLLGK